MDNGTCPSMERWIIMMLIMPKEENTMNDMLDALIKNVSYEHYLSDITLRVPGSPSLTDIGICPKGWGLK